MRYVFIDRRSSHSILQSLPDHAATRLVNRLDTWLGASRPESQGCRDRPNRRINTGPGGV